MDGIIDVECIRLKRQSHSLADRELAAHTDVQIRDVRRKQPQWS